LRPATLERSHHLPVGSEVNDLDRGSGERGSPLLADSNIEGMPRTGLLSWLVDLDNHVPRDRRVGQRAIHELPSGKASGLDW
jgi:hypothetical protein